VTRAGGVSANPGERAFLHRDELAHFWDYSIFLDVPFDEANRRMTERGGLDEALVPDLLRRYNDAQSLYLARAQPWKRASVVIDNSDPTNPPTPSNRTRPRRLADH
jgi:uridine kinase